MTETPATYPDNFLTLADLYSTSARRAATALGISFDPTAAVGAVLEEAWDRGESADNFSYQSASDFYSLWHNSNHASIAAEYAELQAMSPTDRAAASGAWYQVMLDVGPGNIQLYTAISLLEEYNERYTTSDPLGLKHYNNDYVSLVQDLNNWMGPTSINFATLMIQKGLEWGEANGVVAERWPEV